MCNALEGTDTSESNAAMLAWTSQEAILARSRYLLPYLGEVIGKCPT